MLDRVADIAALARWLFPDGKPEAGGRRLRVGDISGARGKAGGGSFIVWLDSGQCYEHNGGERAGDLVDVICERYGLDGRGAYRWLQSEGWLDPNAARRPPERRAYAPRSLRQLKLAPAGTPAPSGDKLRRWAGWLGIAPVGDSQTYLYVRADGQIPLGVARWTTAGGKVARRFGWGGVDWVMRRGATDNAAEVPLFGLPALLARPDAQVLVTEGEKAALAVGKLSALASYVGVAPLGGSSPAAGTDWSALAGRAVFVLGDFDDAGDAFAGKVVRAARGAGAASVLKLDPARVYALLGGAGAPPRGWDVADLGAV